MIIPNHLLNPPNPLPLPGAYVPATAYRGRWKKQMHDDKITLNCTSRVHNGQLRLGIGLGGHNKYIFLFSHGGRRKNVYSGTIVVHVKAWEIFLKFALL